MIDQHMLLSLLQEAHDALGDGDPIPCSCARQGADGQEAVKPYSGQCLYCRIRAALALGTSSVKGILTDADLRGDRVSFAQRRPVVGDRVIGPRCGQHIGVVREVLTFEELIRKASTGTEAFHRKRSPHGIAVIDYGHRGEYTFTIPLDMPGWELYTYPTDAEMADLTQPVDRSQLYFNQIVRARQESISEGSLFWEITSQDFQELVALLGYPTDGPSETLPTFTLWGVPIQTACAEVTRLVGREPVRGAVRYYEVFTEE